MVILMLYHAKHGRISRRVALLGVFLAYAMIISLIERMIPLGFTIPGIRLGLANVAVLLALYLFPISQALILMVLKCLLAALLSGSPASLLYSLSGSILSFLVMAALISLFTPAKVSPLGVSIAGAAFHNTGQILMACLLLESWLMLAYLPVLLLVGTVTGTIVGVLVKYLQPHIKAYM